MTRRMSKHNSGAVQSPALLAVIIGALVLAGGVWWFSFRDSGVKMPAHYNDSNLKKLSNLYTKYGKEHGDVGPANETEFKKFIREVDVAIAKQMDFDPADPDRLFVSPRDGKPFRIRYGMKLGDPRAPVPIIHEQAGVGGRREVGFTNTFKTEEVDEARYRQLFGGN